VKIEGEVVDAGKAGLVLTIRLSPALPVPEDVGLNWPAPVGAPLAQTLGG
jgi:hypothetical protein